MSVVRRHPAAATVLAILAAHLLERLVNSEAEGSVAANIAGSLAMSLPLLWLRSRPLLTVVALSAGGVLNQLIATGTDALFVVLVTLILVGYSIARHHEGRERWLPLGVGSGFIACVEAFYGTGDVLFVLLLIGGGVTGGALVRGRAELTRQLAERTHELEALRELRERDAMLAERRRIARELHDVVAHTVSVMVVQAGGARRQVDRDPERALAALDQVQATGEETLVELQRLFGLLHGDGVGDDARGLDDVPALVDRVRAAGLDVTLTVHGDPARLAPGAEAASFRFVQEALTNVLKHAGGATTAVDLHWDDDALELRVANDASPDGDTSGLGSSGRGLVGMAERIEAEGGTLAAGPQRDGGYRVEARLPLGVREEALA